MEMERDVPGSDSEAADVSIRSAIWNSRWKVARGNRTVVVQAACLDTSKGRVQIVLDSFSEE